MNATVMSHIESDERGLLLVCPNCGKRTRMNYEHLGRTLRCGHCHTALPMAATPVDISSEAAFDALTTRSPLPILCDFWAPWCGPCKMVAPELEKVAEQLTGQVIVAKLNTEELPSLARRFQVSAIPLMAVFHGGREIARKPGAIPAPAIRQFVEQALKSGANK